MTFCVGMKVRGGVVALADTRITRGAEQINKQKLAEMLHGDRSIFTMTSGLRSVRDKTLIYVDERLRQDGLEFDRLYELVNLFGDQLRRVKEEDGDALAATGHKFNLNGIIGGMLPGDTEPQLFYVYPEGNWVEAAEDSPYFLIGRTYYGRPILDRLLTYESSLSEAISLCLLAFDATSESVNDVDYPIDMAVMPSGGGTPVFRRFTQSDLSEVTQWWNETLRESLQQMPMQWAQELLTQSVS